MQEIDLAYICALYREYVDDLATVGKQQRDYVAAMGPRMTPQLDDLEAEITYLLLRATRPEVVVELGTFHGWSTSWTLTGLPAGTRGNRLSRYQRAKRPLWAASTNR